LLLDGSLQIIGLYRKDSGIYICTADNGIGRPIQREFQLEVTGKQHTGHQMSGLKCISLPTICTTCKVVNFNTVHMHEHLTAWGMSSMRSINAAGGNYILTLMFVDLRIIIQFIKKNPTRCNNVSKCYYSIFV